MYEISGKFSGYLVDRCASWTMGVDQYLHGTCDILRISNGRLVDQIGGTGRHVTTVTDTATYAVT